MEIGARTMFSMMALLAMSVTCGVQGGITSPPPREVHYLKTGDRLVIVCEQPSNGPSSSTTNVVWSKASTSNFYQLAIGSPSLSETVRAGDRHLNHPLDHDLGYQTIDTSGGAAPYSITENLAQSASQGGGSTSDWTARMKIVSKLIKDDVTTADSGYYRCRLGIGGVSSRILVSVIDITTKNAHLERVNNDTHLECLVTDLDGVTNYSVTWYKHGGDGNNDDVDVVASAKRLPSGKEKYQLIRRHDGANVLVVRRAGDSDVGIYRCVVTLGTGEATTVLKHDVNLYASPHVRSFQQSLNVVHGHTLELLCQAWGWPTPHVTWFRGQTELNKSTDARVSLSDSSTGVVNALLSISEIGSSPEDRGHYTCVATPPGADRSNYDGRNATIFVRVKGRMAVLWPLLGLAAEAIILLVIITVYEMKRNTLRASDEAAVEEQNKTARNSHNASSSDADWNRKKN